MIRHFSKLALVNLLLCFSILLFGKYIFIYLSFIGRIHPFLVNLFVPIVSCFLILKNLKKESIEKFEKLSMILFDLTLLAGVFLFLESPRNSILLYHLVSAFIFYFFVRCLKLYHWSVLIILALVTHFGGLYHLGEGWWN